jgi:predicted transcriptional regulator
VVFEKDLNTIAIYIITMVTTIQISDELLEKLKNIKIHEKETYESILWNLIEDSMELSEEAKKNISISEKQIKEGKTIPLEELKRKEGF